jgi:hypothetical protein
MARGGKRPGAGRKKGSECQKTRARKALAAKAASEGVTPLEVMLHVMRMHFEAGEFDKAAEIAKDAAPYLHPRLSTMAVSGANKGPIEVKLVRDRNFYRNADRLDSLAAERATVGKNGVGTPGGAGEKG